MAVEPWQDLGFISKIEIVPGPRSKEVRARLEEDVEYDDFYGSPLRKSMVIATNRKLYLTDETVNIHTDFPDDFKKLTAHFDGDKSKAYDAYMALQEPVRSSWGEVPESEWDDCECGC